MIQPEFAWYCALAIFLIGFAGILLCGVVYFTKNEGDRTKKMPELLWWFLSLVISGAFGSQIVFYYIQIQFKL